MTLAARLIHPSAAIRALAKKQKALHQALRDELGERTEARLAPPRRPESRWPRPLTQTIEQPWWTQ